VRRHLIATVLSILLHDQHNAAMQLPRSYHRGPHS
jgi:hypothetical protein